MVTHWVGRIELADRNDLDGPAIRIDFNWHKIAPSAGGATEDFEQMLALLVQTVLGDDVGLVKASPGDWGIDVLYGDLNGTVEIWQAKYFVDGVKPPHKDQIVGSFESAMRAAGRNRYKVRRWVLCVPSSLTPHMRQWWPSWAAKQAAKYAKFGVRLELWDEAKLRSLLARPEAAHVRRIYYGRSHDPGEVVPVWRATTAPTITPGTAVWRAGDEVQLGESRFLIHGAPTAWDSRDYSARWRTATAARLNPVYQLVRLRQVHAVHPHAANAQRRAELRMQARLAESALVEVIEHDGATTVVTEFPPGRPWSELFGPSDIAPDLLIVSAALAAAASVCIELTRLHRSDTSHRTIGPDDIIVPQGSGSARLRDLGFAALTPSPDERPTGQPAPEQARPPFGAGARTDVYQLAALVYHTLTCHLPGQLSPPIRATMPTFPAKLDELLLRCLDADPARRPADVQQLRSALHHGRRQLVRGEPRETV